MQAGGGVGEFVLAFGDVVPDAFDVELAPAPWTV